jgi:hypothetical protein
MLKEKYVFAQLVSLLDNNKFCRIVDKYMKLFTCWDLLPTLTFGQLSNRESLRDLIIAFDAHKYKCYYPGFGKNVSKTSLAMQVRPENIISSKSLYISLLLKPDANASPISLNFIETCMHSTRQRLTHA